MAVFYVYADDSGKFTNQKDNYTALCGYLAHVTEWGRFSMEWNYCRFRWQVPPIHMSAIMYEGRDGEWDEVRKAWGDLWPNKRDMLLHDLEVTIRSAQIVCVGAVVDADTSVRCRIRHLRNSTGTTPFT